MKQRLAGNDSVKGTLIPNAPVGAQGWFGCGGQADLLFEPADVDDLSAFLKTWPADLPIWILGGLANTIIRDGGLRGVAIRLGKGFAAIERAGTEELRAGAGALNGSVTAAALKHNIAGLEFLSGIPGCVGGALRMNAGAYGREVKDILLRAETLDRAGERHVLTPADLRMTYRHTEPPGWMIFTAAVFKGAQADYETIKADVTAIKEKRNATQPIREKTGGSTFANPLPEDLRRAGLPEDLRAWQIVEMVGGRGLQIGGARMSDMHCNFMINTGGASAADLEALGEEIRRRAMDRFRLDLKWEIQRIGEPS